MTTIKTESAIAPSTVSAAVAEAAKKIPQKIFFRIGEVARLLEVKTSVLRFWETEFPSIHPTKAPSGHRVYRRKEVEKLFLIKQLLYVERFSIEGARKKLSERGGLAGTAAGPVAGTPMVGAGKAATGMVLRSGDASSLAASSDGSDTDAAGADHAHVRIAAPEVERLREILARPIAELFRF